LTLWTYGWEEEALSFLQEVAEEYSERVGVAVEVVGVQGDYNQKLLVAIAGGVAPDIALIDAGVVSTNLAYSGSIIPIDQFVDRSSLDDLKSKFYPPAWEAF